MDGGDDGVVVEVMAMVGVGSVISGGNQVYCRYLSVAAKQSHIKILPTFVSSIRRFASSAPPIYNEAFVNDLLSKLCTQERDIESLRKQNELLLQSKEEEAVGFVKQKHPLLKKIESEISNSMFSGDHDKKLIGGFEIISDSFWRLSVNLEGSFLKELIEFGFPGIFGKQIEFRCSVTPDGGYKIDKIKYGTFHKEVAFE
ncbi:hypothetical protein AgCh_008585 [Apium graveolens]